MDVMQSLLIIAILVCASAFLSMSEIALAAARKIKLKLMAESGDPSASKVLALQDQPSGFFAASQIGLNAVAILGGILGEAAFTPYFAEMIGYIYQGSALNTIAFVCSFVFVTLLFILFADLMPKRLAITSPEKVATTLINPLLFFTSLFKPLTYLINGLSNLIFRIFKINTIRDDQITFDDVYAVVDAGAQAGVLQQQEHHLIENVFELESRTLPSSMTPREQVVFFTLQENEAAIREKIAAYPHSKFLVCDHVIDRVVGYIDTKDLLVRILNNQSWLQMNETTLRTALIVPDTLTLSELLDRFKSSRENFAVVINEYALVVGIITLNDVMSTVMGDWFSTAIEEQQVVKRDENSWLIDGGTPIEDVKHALNIDELPDEENYETAAGFIMYMLRKIPKRTDCVAIYGFKFEVVDIDHYKIDQLLVTRSDNTSTAPETVD
ncbi:MAG: hemolysin family protein [Pseudomonadota bacterium]|nr:hemolysin family protein [Pseudomonadota bacterium]